LSVPIAVVPLAFVTVAVIVTVPASFVARIASEDPSACVSSVRIVVSDDVTTGVGPPVTTAPLASVSMNVSGTDVNVPREKSVLPELGTEEAGVKPVGLPCESVGGAGMGISAPGFPNVWGNVIGVCIAFPYIAFI
jgi:hypothetical protein